MPGFMNNGMTSQPNAGYNWGGNNMQSPAYSPQYPPVQPPQQPIPQFVGRYIDDISSVMPNEVPMDGRVALFPKQDLSEVYLKAWNANGEMKTFRYILDTSQNLNVSEPLQEDAQSKIMARLDQLEAQIAANAKPTQKNKGEGGGK